MNALNRDIKKLVNCIEKNETERVNKDYWRLNSQSPFGSFNHPTGGIK